MQTRARGDWLGGDGSAARTRLHATAVSIGVVLAASLCT
jgi:hypothetical protein